MPKYIDTHSHIPGITKEEAAKAHEADLKAQQKYGVKYLQYWLDVDAGKIFCLIDAPSKEAAIAVHKEAHGHVADEINEVMEGAYQ